MCLTMPKVSVTKGFVLDVWDSEQKKVGKKELSKPAVCRIVLSTLDLVPDHASLPDWRRAVDAAAGRLVNLIKEYKNSKNTGKRKQVDRTEVCTLNHRYSLFPLNILLAPEFWYHLSDPITPMCTFTCTKDLGFEQMN